MNQHVARLCQIAQKSERQVVGLMSGTSLDGLDVALCRIKGSGPQTDVQLLRFQTVPYPENFKTQIRSVFATRSIDLQHLCLLNPTIGRLHGQWVLDCLREWHVQPTDVDVIASHGQTIFHAPKQQHGLADFPNATLQIGDGDHIAAVTGILTLSDFRQKHIAHGGEGAPLAVYGDYLMFSKRGETRLMVNLGGIANFTYLPANGDAAQVFTTDTGPGNTLLDALARQNLNRPYDADGALAAQGRVSEPLLAALLHHPFFDAPFPKTTGPELFNLDYVQAAQQQTQTADLPAADVMATLVQFSADALVRAIKKTVSTTEPVQLYVSGGGAHNPVLMQAIRAQLPSCTMATTDSLGISGDAKEAVLFAVLANECLAGGYTSFGNRAGVPSVTMGKISLPG